MLVEHFMEHKQQNKNLSFLAFLEIHYAHGNPKDADYEKDMKLPFKSIVHSSIASISFFSPIPYFKQNLVIYFKNDKQTFIEHSFTFTSFYLSTIWQPPKSC